MGTTIFCGCLIRDHVPHQRGEAASKSRSVLVGHGVSGFLHGCDFNIGIASCDGSLIVCAPGAERAMSSFSR